MTLILVILILVVNQTNKNISGNQNISHISKHNEQKVEIVKIKKQATEKRIFKINDKVC